ncbi:MAG: MBL fold metallo-hydrolase [Treponema sp.]|nr:MBL fold metallo-hydrolase [Treponema sp.]
MSDKVHRLVVGPLETNCWVYPIDQDGAVIIDPGDEADSIISALKKHSLTPKFILLSHGHFDHIGAVPRLKETFGAQLRIAIHKQDSMYLGEDAYKVHSVSIKSAMGSTAFIDAFWKNMPPPDILLEDESEIASFTILHLPGHTQGGVAFWDRNTAMIFTGDTLFKNGYGRTDLTGGNTQQLFESLRRLQTLDPNTVVYPGHGETTTIGMEKF